MSFSSGTRLGPYEITAQIGAGGMGEVYSARDTKLGREVAIKVLPDSFATDPERIARHREAQVLASLNHPNIAHIHGYEESNGIQALVMGKRLFQTRLSSVPKHQYSVAPDSRFLMNQVVEDAASSLLTILLNWKPAAR